MGESLHEVAQLVVGTWVAEARLGDLGVLSRSPSWVLNVQGMAISAVNYFCPTKLPLDRVGFLQWYQKVSRGGAWERTRPDVKQRDGTWLLRFGGERRAMTEVPLHFFF